MKMKQQQQMNLITMNNGFHKFGDIFFYIGVLWVLLYGTYGVAAVGTIVFFEVDGELASVYNSIVNSCLLIGMVWM
ncbi:MAG: hypothetical protein ACRC1D_09095 [Culicoidibacterales bacterium]